VRSNFDDVGDFHDKFNLDNVTHRGAGPRDVDQDLMTFRIKFLAEELKEFEEAQAADNRPAMFDALIDLVYVAMGTAQLLGLPWQAGWDEVQRANMSKVRAAPDGSDSVRGSAFDVVKPPGWVAPDLEHVIAQTLWRSTGHCSYCGRDLAETVLREKPLTSVPGIIAMHCPCGAYLGSRPA
jgi:predicted HAD superfamily Cof-like phosphohydrolase